MPKSLPPPSRWERLLIASAGAAGHVLRFVVQFGTALAGLVALTVGAALIYPPAGWLTLGALLLADRIVDDHRAHRGQQQGGGES